jgi:hypothetical protein
MIVPALDTVQHDEQAHTYIPVGRQPFRRGAARPEGALNVIVTFKAPIRCLAIRVILDICGYIPACDSPVGRLVPISGTDPRFGQEPYEHWAFVPHPLPVLSDSNKR